VRGYPVAGALQCSNNRMLRIKHGSYPFSQRKSVSVRTLLRRSASRGAHARETIAPQTLGAIHFTARPRFARSD
jgi:hypothetical protein